LALRWLTGGGRAGVSAGGAASAAGSSRRFERRDIATLSAISPPTAPIFAIAYAGLPGVSGWMAACI
jgi:hypothetical protein